MAGVHSKGTDHWMTPPWVTALLGPFDLDPCTEKDPVYKHAAINLSLEDDGLKANWTRQRVWLNPPYSRVLPWVNKFVDEAPSGCALVSMKSADTVWFRRLMDHCAGLFVVHGRIAFYTPDGEESQDAWLSSGLFLRHRNDVAKLRRNVLKVKDCRLRGYLFDLSNVETNLVPESPRARVR